MCSDTNLNSDQRIVLAALAIDQPGIVNQLASLATQAGCNIKDSHMKVFGHEFGVLMQLEGTRSALEEFKVEINHLQRTDDEIEIILRETNKRTEQPDNLPYQVHIISLDHPGLVKEVTQYFSEKLINIESLQTEAYSAPHTGSTMFAMTLIISLPADKSIKSLKSDFLDFCDQRNLDAGIELAKP